MSELYISFLSALIISSIFEKIWVPTYFAQVSVFFSLFQFKVLHGFSGIIETKDLLGMTVLGMDDGL